MDTRPWQVGELVALVSREGGSNGALDGILWQVTKVYSSQSPPQVGGWQFQASTRLRVIPAWCATGQTSLRPKNIGEHDVKQRFCFLRLGELRCQLDHLCRNALVLESGVTTTTTTAESDETLEEEK